MALSRRWHLPSAVRSSPLRIEPDRAQALVGEGAVLVDVRRQDDPSVTVRGGVRVPSDEIPGWIQGMHRKVAIVLACT